MEAKETYEVGDCTRGQCPRRNVSAFNALDESCIITDRGRNIGTGQTDAVSNCFDPAPKGPWTFDVSDGFRMQLRKNATNEQTADSFSVRIIRFGDAAKECIDNGI